MLRPFFLLVALALLWPAAGLHAQGFNSTNGRNHPELKWQVAETPHFRIAYPQRLAGIEYGAAALAESTYTVLSRNLNVTFGRKIRIYLSDEDEIVNGFAAPVGEGYTAIWVGQNGVADSWTGGDKWLRRVLPHELTHIFHYRATRSNLGPLGFAFSNPVPRFWTEGLAQYETERWDALRGERWLRTAALESRLSYADGGSLWNGRLLYAVGNAQVRFFAQQYGDSALARLLAHRTPVLLGLGRVHRLEEAFPAVTGESFGAFERRWRQHIVAQYGARAVSMDTPDSLAGRFRAPGQYLHAVQPGPDTSRVAVVRTLSLDRPVRQLVVEGRLARTIAEGAILAPVAWNPFGALVAWAETGRDAQGSLVNDLFLSGTLGEGRRRLTRGRRASSPSFSPDGQKLAFVGSRQGTSNIFLLDLSTLEETPVTAFIGDVQMGALAWHPRAQLVAFSLFDAGGGRSIQAVDLVTKATYPVTDGTFDDRHPVWSRDGRFLAYTSLRDGVPNVFRFDATTGAHARLTALATGIEAEGWLPADSLHPLGQIVGIAAVSKGGDRAYRIDAARTVPEPDSAAVPPAYTAWERHRPPHEVPLAVPVDSGLVLDRYPYRALANLTHVVTIPFPYAGSEKGYGAGAFTAWIEPLGKHAFTGAVGVDARRPADDSFVWMLYRNNVLRPTLDFTFYRLPGAARLYGSEVLVERLTGAGLDVSQPIDRWPRAYRSLRAGLHLEASRSEPLNADSLDGLPDLPRPRNGTEVTLGVRATYRGQKPFRDALVHPLDGFGLRAEVSGALPLPGTDARFVRGDARGFLILPAPGLQRIYAYGRATATQGTPLPQDYTGTSRYDTWQLADLDGGSLTLGRFERVRGYRHYAIGDRVLFGSLEYRVLVARSLQTRLLGVISLGATSLAFFADGAAIWNGAHWSGGTRQVGAGAEVKNALRLGSYTLGHALGIAQPADGLFGSDYDVYYRLRLGVPF